MKHKVGLNEFDKQNKFLNTYMIK